MKLTKITKLIIATLLIHSTSHASNCIKIKPKIIKPLLDWGIIATNTAVIPTNSTFSGKKLLFSLTTNPKSIKNNVSINPQTGEIHIKAETKDSFDISVKAKNRCGAITTTFNVKIEEELF